MAKYCKKCGCYIPDQQVACPACGFDEAAEAAKKAKEEQAAAKGKGFFTHKTAAASATAYAPQSQTTTGDDNSGEYHGTAGNVEWSEGESWRKAADMKREQRQEWERKWAETEHRRREMENEFKRKQAAEGNEERGERRTSYRAPGSTVRKTGESGYSARSAKSESGKGVNQEGVRKILTVLSYLSAMCFIPMFLYSDDDFAQFHAKQGMILFIFGLIADALSAIPVVGGVFVLAKLFFIYKGMMNALSGKKEKLPIIGGIFG